MSKRSMLMKKDILDMECVVLTSGVAHFVQEADGDLERAEVIYKGSDADDFIPGRVYVIEFEYVRRAVAAGTEADSEVGE